MKGAPRLSATSLSDWNPALYMKFEDERTRAARDLLARTSLHGPRLIYDLGCGPGNSTALLLQQYPDARVVGVDTSEAMLAHAQRRVPHAAFVWEDVANFCPAEPPGLIFANAVLHFLPDHRELFSRLTGYLPDGGCLAVQMPNTAQEAAHALMRMVAADGPWSVRLLPIAKSRAVIGALQDYYDLLRPKCARLELWQTTYVHPLDGAQGVVDWFAGSGLRPFLDPLSGEEREQFLEAYRREIDAVYEKRIDGKILLPYPRLFIVATK
jgi:trans-aconitate 2-methyltransferase